MISGGLAITLVLTMPLALLILLGSKALLAPELARKALHICIGLVAASFPWIFSDAKQVWLVVALLTLGFLALRRVKVLKNFLGNSIYSIGRKSYGELCFPVAIGILYTLAEDNKLLYLLPLMIVTFADSLAALAGLYYGRRRYQSPDGRKTIEGSLVMFLVSIGCAFVALKLQTSMSTHALLMVAFNLASMVTLVEAISWRGIDNLMIPLAAYYLLQAYLSLDTGELGAHALMNCVFAVSMLASQQNWSMDRRRRTRFFD